MGRILKKRHRTIQGGNSNLPTDLLINIYIHTHTQKKIKNVYTKIQRVKNVETFNLKSSTCFSNIKRETISFPDYSLHKTKLILNKLGLERLVKRFGVSILLNAYPLSTSLENRTLKKGQANIIINHLIKENNICHKPPIL